MNVVDVRSGALRQAHSRPPAARLGWPIALLLAWVLGWTVIFSAIDFWTIKLYDIPHYSWFEPYRAVMRYGVSWVSPPSFALAENAYFVWMNVYDQNYRMHEWEWYSGNPFNPDGYYNFVWGNGSGGWMRFPMKDWYGIWLLPTVPWLLGIVLWFRRKPRAVALAEA